MASDERTNQGGERGAFGPLQPEHAQNERAILDLEAAYERGWREAIGEVVWVLRDRFDFERIADWIEREFGAAGSKRVPDTSKDLESGDAPTTGRER